MRLSAVLILLPAIAFAQSGPDSLPNGLPTLSSRSSQPKPSPGPTRPGDTWVVPSGTKIPVVLKHAISTKSAKPGDPIYAQTTFPVVIDEKVMIPAGTYVQVVGHLAVRVANRPDRPIWNDSSFFKRFAKSGTH